MCLTRVDINLNVGGVRSRSPALASLAEKIILIKLLAQAIDLVDGKQNE